MVLILKLLFLLTILLSLSTYVLYPLVIMLIGKISPFKPLVSEYTPTVSILITAYNEENDIKQKLENTLELDYPQEKMEIIVGSDGSSDRTAFLAESFFKKGVKLLNFNINRGKTAVQNDLVTSSKNDILVFTDAASFLRKDALRNLVKSFFDQSVGAVAGYMEFLDQDKNLTTKSQGLYWKYEIKLREVESKIGRVIGVDGPLYAVRRENYIALEHHIISDLMTPLYVLKQNKKVVLEKEAIVYEVPTKKSNQEIKTRRRITLRGLIGLFSDRTFLSPLNSPSLSAQIFFHKMLRWSVGILVLLNLFVCIMLSENYFYRYFLFLHILFYFGALTGWFFEKNGRSISFLKVPYYFCLVNFAATLGIIDFLRKKRAVSWKPVR